METQTKAFYFSPQGVKTLSIFGYATKGIPSLEINGAGKLSRNIKEKLIFLTRKRQLEIPLRRYVICVDQNDSIENEEQYLKWLEFPLLLTYWYLAGLVPIKRLDNCASSGWIRPTGEIFHRHISEADMGELLRAVPRMLRKDLMLIGHAESHIRSRMLLEHIKGLEFHYDQIGCEPLKLSV